MNSKPASGQRRGTQRSAAFAALFMSAVGLGAAGPAAAAAPPVGGTVAMTQMRDHESAGGAFQGEAQSAETNEKGETGELKDARADLRGLLKVEDAAEAIAEGEKTGASALAAAHQAVTEWPGVRATLKQNGASATYLENADHAMSALRNDLRSPADLRRDANEVTGALAPLFTHAGDKIPADVHTLDFLGRSIMLDVRGGDWARARRDGTHLESTWDRVRPTAEARRGGAVAVRQFDTAAGTVRNGLQTKSSASVLAATKMVGAAVDTLEKVF